jgi:STE24 endopeptidase
MASMTAHLMNPAPSAMELSSEELAENKRYGQLELACGLADKFIDLAFLSLMAFLIAPQLRLPMSEWVHTGTMQLVAFFGLTMLLHVVVSFPLTCYSGHVLEHQFKLSNLSFSGWFSRYLMQLGLSVVFLTLMFVGLYWTIWIFGKWWWLVGAGAFFVVNVLAGQLLPVLILPLFYKIEKLNRPDLADRIRHIAEGTGLSIEGVYRMDLSVETVKANALLAGLGHTRRVLLGDTALESFTPEELEVIFAHEIGHHVHRHTSKTMLIGVLYSAIGFWLCDRIVMTWAQAFEPLTTYRTLPAFTLPMMMLVLWAFTMLLEPLVNAISRHFERQCDRYALQKTGLVMAYISAFRKLARLNKDDPNPHPLEVFLFHSHPPIAERLAMAECV